ncbi:MAG: DsrE family protein [Succinivibrio sp.]
MKYLFLLRQPCTAKKVHETVLSLLSKIKGDGKDEILAVFFTEGAVSLSVSSFEISDLEETAKSYQLFSRDSGVRLLVCGRAYKESGLAKDRLREQFELSGNMELSMMIADADKVVEF